ncbi:NADH-dependent [FeFe] hydrogenase, group A6 [Peptostreptococcus porci]|uniref:NADH-dependent [FeFe] hydrogenase, group A6 n=1 Tax=Peptostreptococcus porci TaxID=2652282 RepID=UPI002A918AF8|nr:NADH-dependent [FeFe] hydrogenase, group A6 [Peptostreptococcus porci]MDY5437056.1 NADH-dependent [FeFe] hydrogenase, group A6 [Peptostreptococcus porci]MDY6231902.1 NADH-dependent [FeFe] hydrogenase, group A6 [Peptostreptococcus porci]
MVKLTIDNQQIEVKEGTKIIDAAVLAGVKIPRLCFLRDLNEIGACRVCVVEVEGKEKLLTSCNNVVKEGMVIRTNSPKVRNARRTNVELILSQHDFKCATCVRSGNCSLQEISNDLNVLNVNFDIDFEQRSWNPDFPLQKDFSKCIKCMRCIQVCDKIQSLNIWDIVNSGYRTTVDVSWNRNIEQADCSLCGQCITHCPVGALMVRNDIDKVYKALENPELITVVQVAPAVRTAWAEFLNVDDSHATTGLMVASLKRIGFDYVFDTNFSADLTIMEEGTEFLELYSEGNMKYPLFTSCCPGWVRFMKSQYPDMVKYLSTSKSPQQMFGAVAKSYYADILGVNPNKIFCVSIMPCSAKKHESGIPSINDSQADRDVDVVITTRELEKMIKSENLDFTMLKEESFDSPLGIGSGAGAIFGVTGGVMEAALRSAYFLVTGKNPDPDSFKSVRGDKGWKESKFNIDGNQINVAVVSGLGNARKLMDSIIKGDVKYDFVEVMACPGGCSGGGGQPIREGMELASARGEKLYDIDRSMYLRYSHENPSIKKLYDDYLEKPSSHLAHKLLHTDHESWDTPLSPLITMVQDENFFDEY